MAAAALAANLKLQGTLRDGLARLGPLVEETAVKRQAALEDLLSVAYVTVDPNYMEKEWDEEVTEEMIDDCERRGALERIATFLPAVRRCCRQSTAPGSASTPSWSTPQRSQMKPS